MLARKGTLRSFQKGQQQAILAFAQRDRGSIAVNESSATTLELPAVETVTAPLRVARTCSSSDFLPSQHRTDPGQQFPKAERFYDVVIRTEFKADDAIDFFGTMTGGNDDRNVRTRTDFSQKIQPIILTEPQIQNDQTGLRSLQMTIQLRPIGRRFGRDIVIFQIPGHHLSERGVIVNDNNMADFREHGSISQSFSRWRDHIRTSIKSTFNLPCSGRCCRTAFRYADRAYVPEAESREPTTHFRLYLCARFRQRRLLVPMHTQ